MSVVSRQLIIFTRHPEPGTTKTRLIPLLGAEGAAELQRRMTGRTLSWARTLARRAETTVEIRYEGGTKEQMAAAFGADLCYRPQSCGDLGQRLEEATAAALGGGAGQVVIVGTDCPGLSESLVEEAFRRLDNDDVVLGPAEDGGYYLIALRCHQPRLFEGIPWGSDGVLSTTLERARECGSQMSLLVTLRDIDRPGDLGGLFQAAGESSVQPGQRISVVIPTCNEDEELLGAAVTSAALGNDVEVIVVDAVDREPSRRVAEAFGVPLLLAPRGRFSQMNAGAEAAGGDILLFLHADTRLPADYDEPVRTLLARPGIKGGAFRLAFDRTSTPLELIRWAANLRSRWFQRPCGDQGIFVTREVFQQLGGYAPLPIMEDVDLIARLRKIGVVATAPAEVVTATRRWHALGIWRATWINRKISLCYRLGVSPERLAHWYGGRKRVS